MTPERCKVREAMPDEVFLSRLHCWRGARVYFLRAGEGAIKIGWSYNPQARLQSLQTANHEKLALLATMRGGPRQEAYLHDFYAEERLHGEWFTPSARLTRYISCCQRAEAIFP